MDRETELLVVTLPGVHKEALRRLARADAEAMSTIVRELIRRAAKERGFWPVTERERQQCEQEV
jgi:hypothetical protein